MSLLPYRDPNPSPRLMQLMGHLNRLFILPRLVRLSGFDLPVADLDRLRAAVNPSTAAFVAPSHPEFLTDWMIDKELSRRCAPWMASWAANDIVNSSALAQRFWLANGLIANTPGAGGKAYSLRHARSGRGVLLHPEGAVNWQAEKIWPLHPGAIDMAIALAQQLAAEYNPRPVFVVPMVWRLRFTDNVHGALLREMRHIEEQCALSVPSTTDPAERLAGLLGALLAQRAEALGLSRPSLNTRQPGRGYFAAQSVIVAEIRARLSQSYGTLSEDPMHALRTVQRGLRRREGQAPERTSHDRALMTELHRLSRIDATIYGRDTLSQEQVAEILKATRAAVVTRGLGNRLHNFIPRAVGRRVAHVRVAEPMDIRSALADGATSQSLLAELRGRLQRAQDDLGAELEPALARNRMHNFIRAQASNGYATAV